MKKIELIEEMETKLNELVDKADGIELKGHGKNTLLSIANNVTHIYAMNKRWEDVSPSFTPFYAFDVHTQGLWATLWAGVYLELEEEHGIPSEAMQCIRANLEWEHPDGGGRQEIDIPLKGDLFTADVRFFVRCLGLVDSVVGRGEVRESYFLFAQHGVKEDWWPSNSTDELPKREQKALDFMAQYHQVSATKPIEYGMEVA